ncbi:MAG: LysR family transcriptional regulator [Bacillota bacterium]|nr:LysR family transcriptional regulator [Bacillota bacterium]
MHIEYFNYFYQVAKVKSISKVAKQIHISQSALSQQIQKFENSVGYQLFKRSNKGVELTEMGEIVLQYSENILNTYKKMMNDLEKGSNISNTVALQACHSISHYALPCSIYKIKEKYPYHQYELTTSSSDKIRSSVENNICDIGFVYGKGSEENLEYYEVGHNKFVLTSSFYYETPKEITVEDLKNYPIISMSYDDQITTSFEENLNDQGVDYDDLNIIFTLDSIEAIKASLNRKHGLALLPYISIKEELYKKTYKIIQVKDFQMNIKVYMVTRKESKNSKAVTEFSNLFKKIGKDSFC